MGAFNEFGDHLSKYKRLFTLWIAATLFLLSAYFFAPLSFAFGMVLFAFGGITLGTAGVSCAYTIARDSM